MNQDNNQSTDSQLSNSNKAAYKFMAAKKEPIEETKEQEVAEVSIKEPTRKKRTSIATNYANTFLARYELASRQGLHLEKETIATIKRIIQLGDERLTVSGFVENVLRHHFEFYKDEVNRLHEENIRKPIQ